MANILQCKNMQQKLSVLDSNLSQILSKNDMGKELWYHNETSLDQGNIKWDNKNERKIKIRLY